MSYLEQVFFLNSRRLAPKDAVTSDKITKVCSVCMRSFARPCQWAKVNRSFRMRVLCGSGKRPSNTGIAHCGSIVIQTSQHCRILISNCAPATCPHNRERSFSSILTGWSRSSEFHQRRKGGFVETWQYYVSDFKALHKSCITHRRSNSCFSFSS